MIVCDIDYDPKWQESPEGSAGFEASREAFYLEFRELCTLDKAAAGWVNALYFCKIVQDHHLFYVALPQKFLPQAVKSKRSFKDFTLLDTAFHSYHQARYTASNLTFDLIGR